MAFCYLAFGLSLQCNSPIPGLIACAPLKEVNLDVRLDAQPPWLKKALEKPLLIWRVSDDLAESGEPLWKIEQLLGDSYLRLTYGDRTQFILDREGTEIWATWPENLTLEDTATYLLGPAIGLVLRLRGVTCLHASAIAIGEQAIALVGTSGAGKSTTAAAFAQLGYPVISDDIVALVDRHNQLLVQPAYPRIRLWPSAVEVLYKTPDALPRIVPTNPSWNKAYLDLNGDNYRFQQTPLPLTAIYLLGDRTNPSPVPAITTLPSNKALIELIRHTYANLLLDQTMREQEFKFLSQTASQVPVRQVHTHADPSYLFNLCTVILENLQYV